MFDLTPSARALWIRGLQNSWLSTPVPFVVGAGTAFLVSKTAQSVFGSDREENHVIKAASFLAGACAGFYVSTRFLPFHSFTFGQIKELFFAQLPIAVITMIACAALNIKVPPLFGLEGALLGMAGPYASMGFAVAGSAVVVAHIS